MNQKTPQSGKDTIEKEIPSSDLSGDPESDLLFEQWLAGNSGEGKNENTSETEEEIIDLSEIIEENNTLTDENQTHLGQEIEPETESFSDFEGNPFVFEKPVKTFSQLQESLLEKHKISTEKTPLPIFEEVVETNKEKETIEIAEIQKEDGENQENQRSLDPATDQDKPVSNIQNLLKNESDKKTNFFLLLIKKTWIYFFIIFVLIGSLVFFIWYNIYPATIASKLNPPEISNLEELKTISNADILIKTSGNKNVVILGANGNNFEKEYNQSDSGEINLGKLDGNLKFKLYTFEKFNDKRILSTTFKPFETNRDFTAPIVETPNFKDKFPPTNDVNINFLSSERDVIIKNNDIAVYDYKKPSKDNSCQSTNDKAKVRFICPITFPENALELVLNYKFIDSAGNATEILAGTKITKLTLPELKCKPLPEFVKTDTVTIDCSATKDGKASGEGQLINVQKNIPFQIKVNLLDGLNAINIVFTDNDGLKSEQKLTTTKDNIPPKISVTDYSKTLRFNTGDYFINIGTSEKSTIEVAIAPYNSAISTGVSSSDALGRKLFISKGGSISTQEATSTNPIIVRTPNDMGYCQMFYTTDSNQKIEYLKLGYLPLNDGYCNYLNANIIRATIKATDPNGNVAIVICTSSVIDTKGTISSNETFDCKSAS